MATKNLIPGWEAEKIWKALPAQSHVIEYGDLQHATATGRATCKACGAKIAKGEACLKFFYDFAGSGSWTSQEVYMHAKPCRAV